MNAASWSPMEATVRARPEVTASARSASRPLLFVMGGWFVMDGRVGGWGEVQGVLGCGRRCG
jgi:hypothetical protein